MMEWQENARKGLAVIAGTATLGTVMPVAALAQVTPSGYGSRAITREALDCKTPEMRTAMHRFGKPGITAENLTPYQREINKGTSELVSEIRSERDPSPIDGSTIGASALAGVVQSLGVLGQQGSGRTVLTNIGNNAANNINRGVGREESTKDDRANRVRQLQQNEITLQENFLNLSVQAYNDSAANYVTLHSDALKNYQEAQNNIEKINGQRGQNGLGPLPAASAQDILGPFGACIIRDDMAQMGVPDGAQPVELLPSGRMRAYPRGRDLDGPTPDEIDRRPVPNAGFGPTPDAPAGANGDVDTSINTGPAVSSPTVQRFSQAFDRIQRYERAEGADPEQAANDAARLIGGVGAAAIGFGGDGVTPSAPSAAIDRAEAHDESIQSRLLQQRATPPEAASKAAQLLSQRERDILQLPPSR